MYRRQAGGRQHAAHLCRAQRLVVVAKAVVLLRKGGRTPRPLPTEPTPPPSAYTSACGPAESAHQWLRWASAHRHDRRRLSRSRAWRGGWPSGDPPLAQPCAPAVSDRIGQRGIAEGHLKGSPHTRPSRSSILGKCAAGGRRRTGAPSTGLLRGRRPRSSHPCRARNALGGESSGHLRPYSFSAPCVPAPVWIQPQRRHRES